MIAVSLRRALCVALLVSLALPSMVAAAIALHEARHHSAVSDHGLPLLVVLHGHHHDHAVQEHEHQAIARARAELQSGSKIVTTTDGGVTIPEPSRAAAYEQVEAAHLVPPSASDLCTWRL